MNRKYPSLYSSTFSEGLHKVGSAPSDEFDTRLCLAKISFGIIEFLVSSTFLTYGIIFHQKVDLGHYTVQNGLWVTILYYACWSLAASWSRSLCDHLECYGQKMYRHVISTAGIALSLGTALDGFSYTYGICSGVFSSLITIQLKHCATEKFNIEPKVFECISQCGRAASLLVLPHLVLLLIENYTMGQVTYLYGAFILNIIPVALLIDAPDNFQKNVDFLSRYHTLSTFSAQMREMRSFTNSGSISNNAYNESEASEDVEEESLKQPNPDEIPKYQILQCELPEPMSPVQLNVQNYFSKAGVSILPGIPEEEEEDEEEGSDIDVINPKRLSRISNTLEWINKNERKDSIKEIININDLISTSKIETEEKIQNIEFIPNYKSENKFVQELKQMKRSCCYCPPYRIFTWRRRLRSVRDFVVDHSVRPLKYSLKTFYFYPALASKISLAILNTIFVTLVPQMTLTKNEGFKRDDTSFCLSYMAFSWFLFMAGMPLLMTFSGTKIRMTFILGLLVNCVSMLFVTRQEVTTNYMILSCLLFGLGYGCSSFVETILYRSYIGARKWSQVEGTLETLSALFVILIYYVSDRVELDILSWFPFIAAAVYFLNALLWTAMPVLVFVIKYVKGRNSYSLDDLG